MMCNPIIHKINKLFWSQGFYDKITQIGYLKEKKLTKLKKIALRFTLCLVTKVFHM